MRKRLKKVVEEILTDLKARGITRIANKELYYLIKTKMGKMTPTVLETMSHISRLRNHYGVVVWGKQYNDCMNSYGIKWSWIYLESPEL